MITIHSDPLPLDIPLYTRISAVVALQRPSHPSQHHHQIFLPSSSRCHYVYIYIPVYNVNTQTDPPMFSLSLSEFHNPLKPYGLTITFNQLLPWLAAYFLNWETFLGNLIWLDNVIRTSFSFQQSLIFSVLTLCHTFRDKLHHRTFYFVHVIHGALKIILILPHFNTCICSSIFIVYLRNILKYIIFNVFL